MRAPRLLGLTVAIASVFGLGLLAQQAQITNPASSLNGKTLLTAQDPATITGLHTFSRGSSAPFGIGPGAALVPNLNSQLLNGLASTAFARTPSVITTTTVGTVNDFPLSGAVAGGDVVLLANNATFLQLTGIVAPAQNGTRLHIFSIGAGQVDLLNNSGSSAASNRILNGVTSTLTMSAATGRATLVYNATEGKWRVLDHEQGNWYALSFSTSFFSSNGAMVWSIDAPDMVDFTFYIKGKTEWVNIVLTGTSISGTPSTTLFVQIPGQAVAARSQYLTWAYVLDNGLLKLATVASVQGSNFLSLQLWTIGSGAPSNWTASANNTTVTFLAPVEMQ